jgi:C4-dicarboxylate transporter DctM subunit
VLYAVYCVVRVKIDPTVAPEGSEAELASRRPTSAAGRRSERIGWMGVALLIAVTLGSIWLGFATPTEGSALGMLGAILLARAKGMDLRRQFTCVIDSGKTVTPILLLILCATMYTKLLALEGVPETVKELLQAMGLGHLGTFLAMVVVWLVLGCLIDSISIMLLTVPIFWPIAQSIGLEAISFALIGILVIEAGVLTPPFGLGVFVVKAAVPDPDLTLAEIFWGVTPYWVLILTVAAVVYVFPALALWLPSKL